MKKWIFVGLFSWGLVLQAQTFDDLLQNYIGANKEAYLQPVVDLMTGSFNSGWNASGRLDSSFYLKFGVVGMVGYVTDNLKTFEGTTEFPFEPVTTRKVPTIVGDIDPVVVEGVNGTEYQFQGGRSLVLFPLAVPQLSVGGLLNSEISLRFFAYNFGGDFGRLQLFGISGKHDVGHYLGMENWFWNASYSFQAIEGGRYFDFTNHLISTEAGRSGTHWFYQASLGYQYGSLNAAYKEDPDDGGREITVKLKNNAPVFIGVGGGLKLGMLRLNLGINYAKVPFGEFGVHLHF
ncbi:MAG: hypothetical protein IPI30_07525 [Saprospiraceae bacterium]|nr:hypothetical protein [Candidatus Vicinibacter affinis]